jgi:hypothetical protein
VVFRARVEEKSPIEMDDHVHREKDAPAADEELSVLWQRVGVERPPDQGEMVGVHAEGALQR